MPEQLQWYDEKVEGSLPIDALAELRRRAAREGYCYQHVPGDHRRDRPVKRLRLLE